MSWVYHCQHSGLICCCQCSVLLCCVCLCGAASCSVPLCHECTTASVVGSHVPAVNVSVPLLVHRAMCSWQCSSLLLCCFPVTVMCCVCVTVSAVCRAGATISPLMYYYFRFFIILTIPTSWGCEYRVFNHNCQYLPVLSFLSSSVTLFMHYKKSFKVIEVHSTIKLFSHPSIHSQN